MCPSTLVFSWAWETDLFRPSLLHSVSVLQYYTFLYSTFHTAVDLVCAEDVQFWQTWPSRPLSSGSSELTGPEESERDGTALTSDLQEAIAELYEKGSSGPTIADISNWLAGGEEESLQIVTDEEIINNVLQDDHSKNWQESSTPQIIRTILHDDATSAFNKFY
jgi:hypothetical protein